MNDRIWSAPSEWRGKTNHGGVEWRLATSDGVWCARDGRRIRETEGLWVLYVPREDALVFANLSDAMEEPAS